MKLNKINLEIKGKGDSLWCKSDEVYQINKWKWVSYHEDGDEFDYGNIELFGHNTNWYQYTDSNIEKEVNKVLSPILSKQLDCKVGICWSEQGMQPDKGWNFDVFRVKK